MEFGRRWRRIQRRARRSQISTMWRRRRRLLRRHQCGRRKCSQTVHHMEFHPTGTTAHHLQRWVQSGQWVCVHCAHRCHLHRLYCQYGRGGGGMHAERGLPTHPYLRGTQLLYSWDIQAVCEIHLWHHHHPVPPGSDSPGPCCWRRRFWFKQAWWRWWRRGPDLFHCYAGRQYSIHHNSGDWGGCGLNCWWRW